MFPLLDAQQRRSGARVGHGDGGAPDVRADVPEGQEALERGVARLEFAGSELHEKVLPHRVGARQLVHRARQPVEGMDLHPHDHEDHTILP